MDPPNSELLEGGESDSDDVVNQIRTTERVNTDRNLVTTSRNDRVNPRTELGYIPTIE